MWVIYLAVSCWSAYGRSFELTTSLDDVEETSTSKWRWTARKYITFLFPVYSNVWRDHVLPMTISYSHQFSGWCDRPLRRYDALLLLIFQPWRPRSQHLTIRQLNLIVLWFFLLKLWGDVARSFNLTAGSIWRRWSSHVPYHMTRRNNRTLRIFFPYLPTHFVWKVKNFPNPKSREKNLCWSRPLNFWPWRELMYVSYRAASLHAHYFIQYTLASKSNSTRSTLSTVDRVEREPNLDSEPRFAFYFTFAGLQWQFRAIYNENWYLEKSEKVPKMRYFCPSFLLKGTLSNAWPRTFSIFGLHCRRVAKFREIWFSDDAKITTAKKIKENRTKIKKYRKK